MSVIEVNKLRTTFSVKENNFDVIRDISFELKKGEILGIVGESGSGKSVTVKSLMGILPSNAKITDGSIKFLGEDILKMSKEKFRNIRGNDMAIIFQDPMTALNPVKTIGYHLIQVITRHKNTSKEEAKKIAIKSLEMVGISSPESRLNQYPHEFSGGMRQRVLIAMAIACNPKVLIADEPTTALDVTIQAQILSIIKKLQKEIDMSVIIITHDLGVIAELCDRVIVMYGGLVMEEGTYMDIFKNPKNPYTKALLRSVPKLDLDKNERLESIEGTAPSPIDIFSGCAFANRCTSAIDDCRKKSPKLYTISDTQKSRCILQSLEKRE